MVSSSLLFILRLRFLRFSHSVSELFSIETSGETTILFLNFILFVMIRFFLGYKVLSVSKFVGGKIKCNHRKIK